MANTIEPGDETLMMAVRAGARDDLGILFDRHHRALYEFFVRMNGDRPASEALVHEVFERIMRFRDTFRDDGRFRAWLFRLARNVQHDHGRKFSSVPLQLAENAAQRHDPAESRMLQAADAEFMRNTLLGMKEDRRELVVLIQYFRMAPDEIAEVLGLDTSESLLLVQRAMLELRQLFRDFNEEHDAVR